MAKTTGKIIYMDHITRSFVREHRNAIFVFGDNLQQTGFAGQAREMSGEPNTVGVPTKKSPRRSPGAYFCDMDLRYSGVWLTIQAAFNTIALYLDANIDVVFPKAGLGTGLAQLPTRAPTIHAEIVRLTKMLEAKYGRKETL